MASAARRHLSLGSHERSRRLALRPRDLADRRPKLRRRFASNSLYHAGRKKESKKERLPFQVERLLQPDKVLTDKQPAEAASRGPSGSGQPAGGGAGERASEHPTKRASESSGNHSARLPALPQERYEFSLRTQSRQPARPASRKKASSSDPDQDVKRTDRPSLRPVGRYARVLRLLHTIPVVAVKPVSSPESGLIIIEMTLCSERSVQALDPFVTLRVCCRYPFPLSLCYPLL